VTRPLLGTALAAACALAGTGCDEPRRPDVVLITVDTLRADYLGSYGDASATPRIDAFAAGAAVFERCAAPMPLTRPSHFSLFTAAYPREHGVLNNAAALPDEAWTLTEALAEAGWRTGGFVGVRLLGPDSGVDQGFEHFDQPETARERVAAEVVERALAWVAGLGEHEPYFLWVHLFDPHLPYVPPEPYRNGVAADRPPIDWDQLVEIAAAHGGDVPASILDEGLRLYRGEVAYVDHWVGELFDGLAGVRPLDGALVAFTADHGECFENGVWFEHADCMWEPALRVPLIVRHPASFSSGQRIGEQASLVDLAPTVLRAVGLEPPAGLSGRPLQDHTNFGDRHVLVQHPFFQASAADRRPQRLAIVRSVAGEPTTPILVATERVGLVGAEWKLLRTGDVPELYAMTPSPDERTDLVSARPDVAQALGEALQQALGEHPLTLLDAPEINPELLETLRALGYL
jgi:arylsulfatase A-like enzyme